MSGPLSSSCHIPNHSIHTIKVMHIVDRGVQSTCMHIHINKTQTKFNDIFFITSSDSGKIQDSFMNTNVSKSMLMRPFSHRNDDSTDGRGT